MSSTNGLPNRTKLFKRPVLQVSFLIGKMGDNMLRNTKICIIISTIAALIICIMSADGGGINMDKTNAIAIVVALIGVLGSIVVDLIRSKRQSDKIKDGVNDISQDTKDIKPRTQNIEKNTEKIRDSVVEKLVPNLRVISAMSSKIDNIHSEVEYQKRIKSEISVNLTDKDYFVGGIENLYEKIGQLEHQNRELSRQLKKAQEKNRQLEIKIKQMQLTRRQTLNKNVHQELDEMDIEL